MVSKVRFSFATFAAISLVGGLFAVTSSADNTPAPRPVPVPSALIASVSRCGVAGPLVLDPNDHTNGSRHYKGVITFTAKQELAGVNLSVVGPKYGCTCSTCPATTSATGIKPESKFAAGEKRSYPVNCPADVSSGLAHADIKYWVVTSPPAAGAFFEANCSGTLAFLEKAP